MATAEFIGALISLVSKSDIRYQGLLASINPGEATIALERVRSWGTEGRLGAQGRAHEEIPASDHVYEYIMFRAADVKDLKIDDPSPPKPAPTQPALNDPAILNSSAGRFAQPPPPPPPQFNGMPSPSPAQAQLQKQQLQQRQPAKPPTSTDKVVEEMSRLNVAKPAGGASPSTRAGAAQLPAVPHAATAAARSSAPPRRDDGPSMPSNEFDFESANAKFTKHKDAGEDAAAPETAEDSFYDKSGFFDNISSEVRERYEPRAPRGEGERGGARGGRGARGAGRGRANRIAEEAKNMQTFGDTGSAPAGRGRGRPRGRGRGRGPPRDT